MGTRGGVAVTNGNKGYYAQVCWHDASLEYIWDSIKDAGYARGVPCADKPFLDAILKIQEKFIDDATDIGDNDSLAYAIQGKPEGWLENLLKKKVGSKFDSMLQDGLESCEVSSFDELVDELGVGGVTDEIFGIWINDLASDVYKSTSDLSDGGEYTGVIPQNSFADNFIIFNAGGDLQIDGVTIPAKRWFAPVRKSYAKSGDVLIGEENAYMIFGAGGANESRATGKVVRAILEGKDIRKSIEAYAGSGTKRKSRR